MRERNSVPVVSPPAIILRTFGSNNDLELIKKVAGGVDQVDGYGRSQDSPFEPWPAEV